MSTKVCSKCKVEKEVGDFYNNKSRKGGKQHYCIACQKQSVILCKKNNPDKTKERNRRSSANRRKTHPEKVREVLAKWNSTNRVKVAEYKLSTIANLADWYVANAMKMKLCDIPAELIELKREQLKLYRATKQLNQTIKDSENAS